MSEHLPECIRFNSLTEMVKVDREFEVCICEALRQAEQRHNEELASESAAKFLEGQRDALAAAIERVEAVHDEHCAYGQDLHAFYGMVIAAITGESA